MAMPIVALALALAIGLHGTQAVVPQDADFLVLSAPQAAARYPATLNATAAGVKLSNGLVARTFATTPDGGFCTVDLTEGDTTFFRALSPEGNVT